MSELVRGDIDVLMADVAKNAIALRYASKELRNDKLIPFPYRLTFLAMHISKIHFVSLQLIPLPFYFQPLH